MNISIPSNIIKEYIFSKFSDYRHYGAELTVNSIFYDDHKKHLSINLNTGLWQDFKCGETGNFYHLVSFIEGISYYEASKFINSKLLDSPELLFSKDFSIPQPEPSSSIEDEFKNFKPLNAHTGLHSESLIERLCSRAVRDRDLMKGKFYFCEEGRYANRLIVPYIKNNKPYYFQARNMMYGGIKYLNPSRDKHGVKASEILYPFDKRKNYVVVTEGPIDALSLQLNGVNATCSQGCKMSLSQAQQLREKKVIFSYDNDDAGRQGTQSSRHICLRKHIAALYICRPPAQYKDWNEYHTDSSKNKPVIDYIQKNLKKLDFEFKVNELLS